MNLEEQIRKDLEKSCENLKTWLPYAADFIELSPIRKSNDWSEVASTGYEDKKLYHKILSIGYHSLFSSYYSFSIATSLDESFNDFTKLEIRFKRKKDNYYIFLQPGSPEEKDDFSIKNAVPILLGAIMFSIDEGDSPYFNSYNAEIIRIPSALSVIPKLLLSVVKNNKPAIVREYFSPNLENAADSEISGLLEEELNQWKIDSETGKLSLSAEGGELSLHKLKKTQILNNMS